MTSAVMIKLFLAIFINIGILIVVTNANFTDIGFPAILSGDFEDTTRNWHYEVGVPIMTLIMTNIALTVIFAFLF